MKSHFVALLLFSSTAFAQQLTEAETDALLARISASRSGHAIQADFVEKRTLPMWSEPVVETGKIAFEPPDHFLRQTKNLTLSDGKTLWMYYPEFQQVEKYPLTGNGGPGQLFSALSQILQFHNLTGIFKISAARLNEGYQLILTPRSGPLRRMLQSMTLELDSSLKLRSSLMIGKEGDRIETTYSGEKTLPSGSINFSFTPPAAATVVAPLGGG
ncbi:MAG: LolA family protein [Terrimicrobiaceae bacterium]